jgi:hypothetical protein
VGDQIDVSDKHWHPSSQMWNGGVVERISAGYGSALDGFEMFMGICDSCIKLKLDNGTIVYWKNYMGRDEESRKKYDLIRKKKNRDNDIDQLLN